MESELLKASYVAAACLLIIALVVGAAAIAHVSRRLEDSIHEIRECRRELKNEREIKEFAHSLDDLDRLTEWFNSHSAADQ